MNIKNRKKLNCVTNLVINKNTMQTFLSILFYKIILDLSYYFVIFPSFGYMKFELNLNIPKLVESYFLLFIIFILMPKSKEKLSNIMVWLLILISYVPMLTLFAFMNQPRAYMYATTGFWMLVFLLLKLLPTLCFSSIKKIQSKIIGYSIFIGLGGIVFFLIYKYLGITFNFDLTKVYEIRRKYLQTGIPFAGYLFTWLTYIVNPIFFALFLVKRKWIWVGIITFLQILVFSVTGLKSFLFVLPFILGLIWIVSQKNPLAWMSASLSIVILAGIFSCWLLDNLWISSLFTRRALLVPAQLSFFYYDFFSQNHHVFLSQHHLFRNFLEYPYNLKLSYLIADVYFNSPKTNACNGIYADAYMNFGFIGFVLWAFLLTIILKLIDSFSKDKDMRVTIAATAMPAIALTNSPLLTCLLTHGLLLALLLLYLLPKRNEN